MPRPVRGWAHLNLRGPPSQPRAAATPPRAAAAAAAPQYCWLVARRLARRPAGLASPPPLYPAPRTKRRSGEVPLACGQAAGACELRTTNKPAAGAAPAGAAGRGAPARRRSGADGRGERGGYTVKSGRPGRAAGRAAAPFRSKMHEYYWDPVRASAGRSAAPPRGPARRPAAAFFAPMGRCRRAAPRPRGLSLGSVYEKEWICRSPPSADPSARPAA